MSGAPDATSDDPPGPPLLRLLPDSFSASHPHRSPGVTLLQFGRSVARSRFPK